jgi:hypothetical protein
LSQPASIIFLQVHVDLIRLNIKNDVRQPHVIFYVIYE